MIAEFREFINRGSMIELAVGFVMGVAFQDVISALTDRVLMPLIALIFSQPSFDAIGRFGDDGSVGAVLTALVNFLLVAVALFVVVKAYNKMQRKSPEQDAEGEEDADPDDVVLLREIRDALRERA